MYELLGFIILRIRFPNTEEREKIFEETYCYTIVGAEPILKIVSFVFIIALTVMFIGVIYTAFTHDASVL